MKHTISRTLAAFTLASCAWAGSLTGTFVLPTQGPVANATLLLQLSQAATLPGTFSVAPVTVSCATSTDGSVVGVANPLAAPTVAVLPGGGTLAAGTYFVEITYTSTGSTQTLASPVATAQLTASGEVEVEPPVSPPGGASGYSVYIGTTPGSVTLQGSVSGLTSPYYQSAALSAGSAAPGSNSTVCAPIFNDALIPTFTYYRATLEDSTGQALPGYPQKWYLAGSNVDVSNLEPLSSNPAVRFPMPVLANPASTQPQSVGSPLNLNNFGLSNAGNVGPGFVSMYWSGALPASTTAIGGWTPNVNVELRRMNVFAQNAGSGGAAGTTITVTDGTSNCVFSHLLTAAAASSSVEPDGFGAGCSFSADIPLTVEVSGDDHSVRPGNVSWAVEMTVK